MAFGRHLAIILLATALLTTALVVLPTGPAGYCMAETDEVKELREELNATRDELVQVKEERDDYAQRLEDATTIMILVIFLLAGSYVVFYVQGRRQRVVLMELEKRAGVSLSGSEPRPRRRRKG